jgi:hypothetical protein
MRFTFVILLFCCLGADAQMIIKAHANYRPYAVAAANLLLDDYSGAAAAYSLRKLRTAYTGNAIRVRRSNDNTEQDIGFTASGDLDTASLKTFVGANSGFVTTWYDQSTNARNATQSTAANQPRIINSGVVERRNTKVTVIFDGTNDHLSGDNVATDITGEDKPFSILSVVSKADRTGNESTYGLGNSADNNPLILPISYFDTSYRFFIRQTGTIAPLIDARVGSIVINTQYLLSNFSNGLSYNLYRNNTFLSGQSYNTTTITLNTATIGAVRRTTTIDFINGDIQEIIIYASDQSTNRTGLSTNINSYYAIY